jgi:hypothetical protein
VDWRATDAWRGAELFGRIEAFDPLRLCE